ncbi:serine hydrolase domain-containing protein [Micromonospora musae]|uniref:serine hydrolase domain-containing protein n=1 Tax=Micromonospora musae TaxID=1894970 RepID=UPI00341769E8
MADYLHQHMTENRVPGMAYAIVRGDQVIDQRAWGIDGDGRSITPQTPFVLGSLTKSFTALAVMQLVEAGRVELDAPVRRHVPWLRLAEESVTARITVRQLMTHTTGLPQVAAMGLTDRYDNTPDGLTRSVRDLAGVRSTARPGGAYQYSDANYMILGALVEAVTGQAYGEHLRAHVLDPLGMTNSAATAAEARVAGVPAGHRYYFGRPQRFGPPFDTSGVSYGFLAASLSDLTHYALAQLNDGRYADTSVLSPQGIAQLHAGQVSTDGGGGRYGLGWRESTLDGTGDRIVWHAGATANYFSHLVLVPESDLAVVILSNVYSLAMDGPLTSAAFNVARMIQGGAPQPETAKDPILAWTLSGLLALAGLLLALLIWSLVRAPRSGRATRSWRRIIAGAAGSVASCVTLLGGTLWVLPAMWDGAGLAQVLLFAPDIGHAMIAVAVLTGAIAVVRLGAAGYALTRR